MCFLFSTAFFGTGCSVSASSFLGIEGDDYNFGLYIATSLIAEWAFYLLFPFLFPSLLVGHQGNKDSTQADIRINARVLMIKSLTGSDASLSLSSATSHVVLYLVHRHMHAHMRHMGICTATHSIAALLGNRKFVSGAVSTNHRTLQRAVGTAFALEKEATRRMEGVKMVLREGFFRLWSISPFFF